MSVQYWPRSAGQGFYTASQNGQGGWFLKVRAFSHHANGFWIKTLRRQSIFMKWPHSRILYCSRSFERCLDCTFVSHPVKMVRAPGFWNLSRALPSSVLSLPIARATGKNAIHPGHSEMLPFFRSWDRGSPSNAPLRIWSTRGVRSPTPPLGTLHKDDRSKIPQKRAKKRPEC